MTDPTRSADRLELLGLMGREFEGYQRDYLQLMAERTRTEEERKKILRRMQLLSQLLELEGQKVELP